MQQVVTRALTGLTLTLLLAGCPPRKPPADPVSSAAPPLQSTLARTWADVDPAGYPELADGPVEPALLRLRHDVDRWTLSHQRWGEIAVLHYEDTDHPSTAQGAVAGWLLADSSPDAPRVQAVVLRDFQRAPVGPSFDALLLSLGEAWLTQWTLCRPIAEAHADLIVAVDESARRKLALAPSTQETEGWTVDHIEYLSAGLDLEPWFARKGYGGCEPLGTLLENGRIKPPRPTADDQVAP